ncbi:MAG TPA: ATP-binding protein [Gammaproteobacteria bacterium]|nr:ATP-binding protein [Gammaproteobacteria bacterium]
MTETYRLDAEQLFRSCDPQQFDFHTTGEVQPYTGMIGQDRALDALRFGVGIRREGYNLYVLGPPGAGKHTAVLDFLAPYARNQAGGSDWCYVNNFHDPQRPSLLRLPAGRGSELRRGVAQLVDDLGSAIPAAFESEEYQTRLQELQEEMKERQGQALQGVRDLAERKNIVLLHTPGGFAFAPTRKGEVLGPDEFEKLPEEERSAVEQDVRELQEQLKKVLKQFPQWQHEARRTIKKLNREVTLFAVGHLIEELLQAFQDLPGVGEYLNAVQQDIVDNADNLRRAADSLAENPNIAELDGQFARRYQVNLLVGQEETDGAPVIYQDHPTYDNLLGRVEHTAQMGTLFTDFTLIRSGALHRANGGYLILDADKVLTQPYAWEGLKRAIKSGEVNIESIGQALGLISTISLEPEAVPLDLKVVLVGDRMVYYLLSELDPEFKQLFKVEVDFNDQMVRDREGNALYARLIATMAQREELAPLERGAVARVVEHSARLAEDAEHLSTDLRSIGNLLCEADYWARERGTDVVEAEDVQQAIDAQIRRRDRIRERLQEEVLRGTVLIDSDGEAIAQINALSVIELGGFMFGVPTRVTATARLGEGEVVDIEREVELGGALHSKGVLILSHFLAARYCADRPLSLSASVVFEQNYGQVEGDSASLAELCALLSALARAPIRQSLAVTGSVNQLGQVQAIGGVNAKVEGFFDICNARGLTGRQGVVIPASNVPHLMLREDVVDAVKNGRFHVYAVDSVDAAVQLLTGVEAGERGADGNFPDGTVNQRIEARLNQLAEERQAHSEKSHDSHDSHDGDGGDAADGE